jgi:hypothetical protein
MSIFSVGLLMSQIDFLLIRLAADLMVNTFTTFKFLTNKEVNRRLYYAESHQCYTEKSSVSNQHKQAEEMTDMLGDHEERPLNISRA